jgi:hypothetical protein
MGHSGQFKKGDPRISPYRKGDGRKRYRFPKGKIANPRLAEVCFQKGNKAGANEDGPKTYARSIELIPQEFHVHITPGAGSAELVKILDETIAFGRQMQEMVSRSANPMNNKATGRYTAILDRCLETSARIKGGTIQAATYGRLNEQQVHDLKEEYRFVLSNNATKMKHSVEYARREQQEAPDGGVWYPNIFDTNGEVKTWASDGFCFLIAGTRQTVELMVALEVWEHKIVKPVDSYAEAMKRRKRE